MNVYPKKRKKRRPPFVIAYKAILRDSDLSMQARFVLYLLKTYANSDGTHCFPSLDTLCKAAGCPRRSMSRHLSELRKAGLIFTKGQRVTKEQKLSSSTYLIYDDLQAKAAHKPRAIRGARKLQDLAHGSPENIVDLQREMEKREFATEIHSTEVR